MHTLARLGFLGTLLFTFTPAAPGQTGNACAPGELRAPMLSWMRRATGEDTLYLQADPSLVGGRAALLVEDPHGPHLPPGPCTSGLRGRLLEVCTIRPEGRAAWEVPPAAAGAAPLLRALAWPAGGGWADVHVSNTIVLPPHQGTNALTGGPAVVITEFQKDPTVVSDAQGEWIEVMNTGASPVDIEGWVLADLGSDQTILDAGGQGIVVPPGGAIVLGRQADPALNGGIRVHATYFGLTLANGEDELLLIRPDGAVADQVIYDDGVNWPDEAGRAIALDPTLTDAAANDDGANWCSASSITGAGPDTGTPAATNDTCGG